MPPFDPKPSFRGRPGEHISPAPPLPKFRFHFKEQEKKQIEYNLSTTLIYPKNCPTNGVHFKGSSLSASAT